MWASFQMRRSIEIYIRGCQNCSFSNTQDILSILTGSLHDMSRRCEGQFSAEGLTEDELEKSSITRRADWKHALTAAQSACRLRLGFLHRSEAMDPNSASKVWEKKAEAVMKSDTCKNRNDIAGQSTDFEWQVRPGETSVQILQMLQGFMSETGHAPQSFPDRIVFVSMSNDRSDPNIRSQNETERSDSVSSPQTTSLSSGTYLSHNKHSICAVSDHVPRCNPPICAVVTTCFLNQRNNMWKKHLNPHSKNSV